MRSQILQFIFDIYFAHTPEVGCMDGKKKQIIIWHPSSHGEEEFGQRFIALHQLEYWKSFFMNLVLSGYDFSYLSLWPWLVVTKHEISVVYFLTQRARVCRTLYCSLTAAYQRSLFMNRVVILHNSVSCNTNRYVFRRTIATGLSTKIFAICFTFTQ